MPSQQHKEFVKKYGAIGLMYKPPSVSDSELEDIARKTLLSIEELQMHFKHLRITAERRTERAKKAASTRKSKSTTATTRKGKKKKKTESNY